MSAETQSNTLLWANYLIRRELRVHRDALRLAAVLNLNMVKMDEELRDELVTMLRSSFAAGESNAVVEARASAILSRHMEAQREMFDRAMELTSASAAEAGNAEADRLRRDLEAAGLLVGAAAIATFSSALDPLGAEVMRSSYENLVPMKFGRMLELVRDGLRKRQTPEEIVTALFAGQSPASAARSALTAIVRTAYSEAHNAELLNVYRSMAGIVVAYIWISVIDSRTSDICRSRNGNIYPLESTVRPPAHYYCRSVIGPVFASEFDRAAGVAA